MCCPWSINLQNRHHRSSGSSGASRRPRGSGDFVYEHTVQTGQTLSEIASAYGVSVKAIMEENNIKNANMLRAGQIIYIPE